MGVGKSCLLHQFTEKKCELLFIFNSCLLSVFLLSFLSRLSGGSIRFSSNPACHIYTHCLFVVIVGLHGECIVSVKVLTKMELIRCVCACSHGRLSSHHRGGVWNANHGGSRSEGEASDLGHGRTGALSGRHQVLLQGGCGGPHGL